MVNKTRICLKEKLVSQDSHTAHNLLMGSMRFSLGISLGKSLAAKPWGLWPLWFEAMTFYWGAIFFTLSFIFPHMLLMCLHM